MYKKYMFKSDGPYGYVAKTLLVTWLTTFVLIIFLTQARAVGLGRPVINPQAIGQFQAITITGRVVDQYGKPLKHVSLKLKSGKSLCTTNDDGKFSIQCDDENAIVRFSHIGYQSKELLARSIQKDPIIKMKASLTDLSEVKIESKIVGTKIDLTNRQHQNLAQVLEGSVPGLILKEENKTEGEILVRDKTSRNSQGWMSPKEMWDNDAGYNSSADLLHKAYLDDYNLFLEHVKKELVGPTPKPIYNENVKNMVGVKIVTSTKNSLVPQLRGGNSFPGNTEGMLIVIDGFPQEGFPKDLPMNNIASVEVIKDPERCLEWGAKGVNGVILISTNPAKAERIRFNYSSNYYLRPKPDNSASALRLGSTADFLAYRKELYDRRASLGVQFDDKYLFPSTKLLYELRNKTITQEEFDSQWHSLGLLSNREQLDLLQRNSFTQNQSLSISGGTRVFKFTIGGVYGTDRSVIPGTGSQNIDLNLNNQVSLFNQKLTIRLMGSLRSSNNKSSGAGTADQLEPYQMLLDGQGNYIRHNLNISEKENKEKSGQGGLDYGFNPLEDMNSSKTINKALKINTNLNIDWQLMPGLKWSTSFIYGQNSTNNQTIEGIGSSKVRQLLNDYAVIDKGTKMKAYHIVPIGGFLDLSSVKGLNQSLRSGLSFRQKINGVHQIDASLDAGLSNGENHAVPNSRRYGYDPETGQTKSIIEPDFTVENFDGTRINIDRLMNATLASQTYNRNIAFNGSLSYQYLDRYSLRVVYNSVLNPNYGQTPAYSTTSSRSLAADWDIDKESFFKISWITRLKMSITASEMIMAKLPESQIKTSVIEQPLWKNKAIWISDYNPTQLSGQANRTLGGRLNITAFNDNLTLMMNGTYNSYEGTMQWNGRLGYDIARQPYFKLPWFSSLRAEASMQSINPYQGQSIAMGAGSLSSGGGFNATTVNDSGILPPQIDKKELNLFMGFIEDRYTLNIAYYDQTTSGQNSGSIAADPATGLSSKRVYSSIKNKGLEFSLRAIAIKRKDFTYSLSLNASYNVNMAIEVETVPFNFNAGDASAQRSGYPTDNLWSLPWAGLSDKGDPQIYSIDRQKVSIKDTSLVVASAFAMAYSGRTTAPWTGALMQNWEYKNIFASARLMFQVGHVMRMYKPYLTPRTVDRDISVRDRWKNPGEESGTDIAAISRPSETRGVAIKYSDNSIMPADNLGLREIQLGYRFPEKLLGGKMIKSLSISAQVQDVAVWTRNKLHLDPNTVSNTGTVSSPRPTSYVLSVNMSF